MKLAPFVEFLPFASDYMTLNVPSEYDQFTVELCYNYDDYGWCELRVFVPRRGGWREIKPSAMAMRAIERALNEEQDELASFVRSCNRRPGLARELGLI